MHPARLPSILALFVLVGCEADPETAEPPEDMATYIQGRWSVVAPAGDGDEAVASTLVITAETCEAIMGDESSTIRHEVVEKAGTTLVVKEWVPGHEDNANRVEYVWADGKLTKEMYGQRVELARE